MRFQQAGEDEMAKAKKGKSGGASAPKEMLLVSSKVKQMIRDAGCNTAGDALEGLNGYVGWLVHQAARRASENGRKTVRAHEFMIF
jgi:hypothetical protein